MGFSAAGHPRGTRLNQLGTAGYAVTVIGFSIVFWAVAFLEFMRPAEAYMNRKID